MKGEGIDKCWDERGGNPFWLLRVEMDFASPTVGNKTTQTFLFRLIAVVLAKKEGITMSFLVRI